MTAPVQRCEAVAAALEDLLARLGLALCWCEAGARIPGSYWGEPEAGRIGAHLYVRADTPLHSVLHEAGHYLCMDRARRERETIDAGGSAVEECAVCYLQILLADRLPRVGRTRMWVDMDVWGYSFRLGSARAWFEHDAEDARAFLVQRGLIDPDGGVAVA